MTMITPDYNAETQFVSRRRTRDWDIYLYEADKVTPFGLSLTDVVRVKVYSLDGDVVLDIDSVAATTAGSVVTITGRTAPAHVVFRIAQDDAAKLCMGSYKAEVDVVDDSETAPANAIKLVGRWTLKVLDSAGGDVGLI